MTTKVVNLAEDLDQILKSFSSMLEGVYFVDEDLAESLAVKFSEELRLEVRKVYASMAKDVAISLAKPPTKRRRKKKKVERTSVSKTVIVEDGIEAGIGMAVGVEELEDNLESLLQHVPDDQGALEDALTSQSLTARSGQQAPDATKWDTENPTMRPMRPDDE